MKLLFHLRLLPNIYFYRLRNLCIIDKIKKKNKNTYKKKKLLTFFVTINNCLYSVIAQSTQYLN